MTLKLTQYVVIIFDILYINNTAHACTNLVYSNLVCVRNVRVNSSPENMNKYKKYTNPMLRSLWISKK